MPIRSRFDERYYRRFYGDATDRAAYRRDERRLGAFLCAYLRYLDQPVRSVLDVGCGFGHWRGIIAEHFPRASYVGIERSRYLCERHGWVHASATEFRSDRRFDLIICKDTLQYLPAAELKSAVANLADLCSGALYTSILTRRDWHRNCDRHRTDDRVYMRPANWYRAVLGRHFTNLGGGVFLSHRSDVVPWELETLPANG